MAILTIFQDSSKFSGKKKIWKQKKEEYVSVQELFIPRW